MYENVVALNHAGMVYLPCRHGFHRGYIKFKHLNSVNVLAILADAVVKSIHWALFRIMHVHYLCTSVLEAVSSNLSFHLVDLTRVKNSDRLSKQ